MKLKFLIRYSLFFASSVIALGCQTNTSTEKQQTEEKGEQEHEEEALTLTAAQEKQVGLTYTNLSYQMLSNGLVLNGVLDVPNDKKAYVTSVYGGVLEELYARPGDFVKKGQILGKVLNPDLIKMQEQLQLINNQISLTQIEVNRQKELVEGNAAPLKKLQQVEVELANLKAQKNSLSRQLSSGGGSLHISSQITIKAPISGVVASIQGLIGTRIEASSPILEIVNNDALHVDMYVYEKDFSKVKKGQKILFSPVNNANASYEAKIDQLGQAFEKETNAIAVHAQVLGNKEGLINGMQVQGTVVIGDEKSLAVPTDCIVSAEGKDYIFILKEDHKVHGSEPKEADTHSHEDHADHNHGEVGNEYERVPVVKGVSSRGYTAITPIKELDEHTKIVQKGAFFLLAKMTNSGEHSH
ncbi:MULTISPECIES: efflux RND transporter periplasmic adaptor subunit [Sphingobacterium]|uniref:efflux RND transporter periplasmic adaptor subunit n=1 Tax=Sphingobacterium TaxID=28453 RepID=UPI00104DA2D9|nr:MULTISPECIES: efflux RND transporter periplasmic adaptor subunit [Sphingobacterium]MCW2258978.1 RND family efflux transporter MFP subunit [Sphingobacterium kitahiroshimense]TCR14569.1 RND family efflux transporter MFP subunit [Sphingobacterium sp. JUb78]